MQTGLIDGWRTELTLRLTILCHPVDTKDKGTAKEHIEAGDFALTGKYPLNVGGGLKSFGHPVGASGIREVFEGYQEILGKAQLPERQLKNVKLALGHNQGGNPGRFICSICIVGQP